MCLWNGNSKIIHVWAGLLGVCRFVVRADDTLNESCQRLPSVLHEPKKEQIRMAQVSWIEFGDHKCAFEANNLTNEDT